MTEVSFEIIIAVLGAIVSPIIALQIKIWEKLSSLCERVARTETENDIYHNGKDKLD